MSQAIYLANNTHKPIQCIVLPDPNALLVDIFKPEALSCLSAGETFKTIGDLINHYKTAATGNWQNQFAQSIGRFFQQEGATVYPGEDMDVYNISPDNPLEYFNPSYVGANFGTSPNITLLLRTDDGRFACTLAAKEGQCWIVQKQKVGYDLVHAAEGHHWVPDADAGRVVFEPIILEEESTA